MAYRLKKNESVPEGIKRIVLEEMDSAAEQLSRPDHRDESIHEARKSLKKIRGAVRLIQPELGRLYQRENAELGGMGRRLSELRDAAAILEVFDALIDKFHGALRKDALLSVRLGLEKSKRRTEDAADPSAIVQQTLTGLRAARRRVKTWPLASDGFAALAGGFKDRYRRGRRALAAARKQATPESYHEWRKRVKDHWYHVRLLSNAWTGVLEARETSLKSLETCLGDDHNLVVLCDKIGAEPELFGPPDDIHLLLALANQRQRELRQDALSLGERLYEEKPRDFTRSFSKLWEAWHSQSDTLSEPSGSDRAPRKQPRRASAKSKKSAAA